AGATFPVPIWHEYMAAALWHHKVLGFALPKSYPVWHYLTRGSYGSFGSYYTPTYSPTTTTTTTTSPSAARAKPPTTTVAPKPPVHTTPPPPAPPPTTAPVPTTTESPPPTTT